MMQNVTPINAAMENAAAKTKTAAELRGTIGSLFDDLSKEADVLAEKIFTSKSLANDVNVFLEKLEEKLERKEDVNTLLDEIATEAEEDSFLLEQALRPEELLGDVSGTLTEILEATPDAYLRDRMTQLAKLLYAESRRPPQAQKVIPTQRDLVTTIIAIPAMCA